jgi:hypothetical protein
MGLAKEKEAPAIGGCLFTSEHKTLVASSGILETSLYGDRWFFKVYF